MSDTTWCTEGHTSGWYGLDVATAATEDVPLRSWQLLLLCLFKQSTHYNHRH